MFRGKRHFTVMMAAFLIIIPIVATGVSGAAPPTGGTLDPTTIKKYVTPLVIPPVMPAVSPNSYSIAVRQFRQQILPTGLPSTIVWSYGDSRDPVPAVAPSTGSSFNYPAFTIETSTTEPVNVRWINELVAIDPGTGKPYPVGNPFRTFLPHVLPVDQTLHWANPGMTVCRDGSSRTDCATNDPAPYGGPVPMVVHLHGAHVDPQSDGYPEAWWLPVAINTSGYASKGTLFNDVTGTNPGDVGYADYMYRNDQPATTLWYHDHSLGMTRSNVYAGPAGFWLVRGGTYDGAKVGAGGPPATLPGPAPTAGQTLGDLNTPGNSVRNSIREIPIVIQDRSFNQDGSLFYPASRVFFDGFAGPYIPQMLPGTGATSDIAPLWNPEAFFNTIVVNGNTWPVLEVAPALYRFRLLNGCNSRFLNLSLHQVWADPQRYGRDGKKLPFYQIGAEQGFLPSVVMVQKGYATPLPGNGTVPRLVKQPHSQQALLLAPAERADTIVDFRGLANGTRIRMTNTAPDSPFGGFPTKPADFKTTGQVMEFVVNVALNGASPTDPSGANPATDPLLLVPNHESGLIPPAGNPIRNVSLNENESDTVCVDKKNVVIPAVSPPLCGGIGVPAAPQSAMLGLVDPTNPTGIPLGWRDDTHATKEATVAVPGGFRMVHVTENPAVGAIEDWAIHNFTEDAHPIHLHMVRFQVVSRTMIDGITPSPNGVTPWETGYKDTVIAYPDEITTVRAKFDIAGLFVWHCHILEHEDNEMMRPYFVGE